jgi:hypothetical protein
MSPDDLSMPAEQSVGSDDQQSRGQSLFRKAQGCQQQSQLFQTAVSRLAAPLSLHDQQLLAEEQDLAVPVK